jgi:CheY-like chemotaxis protein
MNRDVSTGATTVLVVDEEPIILDMISEELTSQGFSVLAAETGEAALSIIESDQRVDLLLTDIWLPGELDGWRLAETARQTRPKLAVIYVIGYTVERGEAVPGSVFLKKPYRPSEIVATILTLIAPHECPTGAALRPL